MKKTVYTLFFFIVSCINTKDKPIGELKNIPSNNIEN